MVSEDLMVAGLKCCVRREIASKASESKISLHPMANRKKTTPMEVFSSKKRINICAPMVRYSKLPFRELVRKYVMESAFLIF